MFLELKWCCWCCMGFKGFCIKLKVFYFTGDVAFRILENIHKVKLRGLRGAFQDTLEAETQIYVCDINPKMLNVGKRRASEKGKWECFKLSTICSSSHKEFWFDISSFARNENFLLIIIGFGEDGSLVWVEGNAESLSFQNDSMDGYTIAFGIRNVTHIEKVLSEAHRYLHFFKWLL